VHVKKICLKRISATVRREVKYFFTAEGWCRNVSFTRPILSRPATSQRTLSPVFSIFWFKKQ
jgi:hypothetical protein